MLGVFETRPEQIIVKPTNLYGNGARRFVVEIYTDSAQTNLLVPQVSINITSSTQVISHTFTNLSVGRAYYIKTYFRSSSNSTIGTVYVDRVSTKPYSASGLGLISSDTGITASWTRASSGSAGYRTVLRYTSSGGQLLVDQEQAETSTVYQSKGFSGLLPNTLYYVGIQAYPIEDNRQISPVISNPVDGRSYSESIYSTIYTRPGQPTGLYASPGETSVSLSWNAPSMGASSYYVELYNGSTRVDYKTVYSTSTSFTGLTAARTYTFRVYANGSGGQGSYSSSNFTTSNGKPGDVQVSTADIIGGDGKIYISQGIGGTLYRLEVYEGSSASGTIVINANVSFSSGSYTFSGLKEKTTYTLKAWAQNNSSGTAVNGDSKTLTFTTKDATRPTLNLAYIRTAGSVQVIVNGYDNPPANGGSDSGLYGFAFWISKANSTVIPTDGSGVDLILHGDTSNRAYSYTVDADGKSLVSGAKYRIGIAAIDGSYNQSPMIIRDFTFQKEKPGDIQISTADISGGSGKIYISQGTGGTLYRLEIYEGNSASGTPVRNENISINVGSYTFSGLKEKVTYTAKAWAQDNTTETSINGDPKTISFTTTDITKPSVGVTSVVSVGSMKLTVNGFDNSPANGGLDSGLKGFYFWISRAGATSIDSNITGTFVSHTSTSSRVYTFTKDADGKDFVFGTKYVMGVASVDGSDNQSTRAVRSVTYERGRPSNFTWTTNSQIVKGNGFSITAAEWNSFGIRLNEFRLYKGLSTVNFTSAVKGANLTATMYNQVRDALAELSPPTSPPGRAVKYGNVLASHFTGLTNSLNSIG